MNNLKVGDRVRVIKALGFGFMTNCKATIYVIDNSDYTIKVMPDNDPNGYWVEAASFEYEILPPTPKWLPIDRDNLPDEPVLAGNIDKNKIVVNRITINHLDGTIQSHNRREYFEVTHYIPLSDLINLPIAE